MTPKREFDAPGILRCLEAVAEERARRASTQGLAAKVHAVKVYQQARFRLSHADLLSSPRYGMAAGFFLEELYGPRDFSARDAQFARIVPALVRLFQQELVQTVATLAELHALTEALDSAMGEALPSAEVNAHSYALAWRAAGRADDRERQIALVLDVGRSLERYTRMPALTMSLRMMRGPARAAGLSELQSFLERGFATFKAMRGADDFLRTMEQRERALVAQLFAGQGSGQLP